MLGNIGKLFVQCMQQVTKGHVYLLLGVWDYYVMYGPSQFCETSAKVTNWVTDFVRFSYKNFIGNIFHLSNVIL